MSSDSQSGQREGGTLSGMVRRQFKRHKSTGSARSSCGGGLKLGRLGKRDQSPAQPIPPEASDSGCSLSEIESLAAGSDAGPNTPAALQEVYEAASGSHIEHIDGVVHQPDSPFSEQELKDIFSGAPHFLLERGRNSLWYPHILFPWDDNTSIQNLRDRKPLNHPSHSLSTLHAHLPVCQDPNDPRPTLKYWTQKTEGRRPTFDLGVFEVPNMLSARAKEPGCVGFRNYLELPIAHSSRYIAHTHSDPQHKDIFPGTLSSRPNDPYSYCRPRIMVDRADLLREGPTAWRRLGVRSCSMKAIAERLEKLCGVREDVMCRYQQKSILDNESVTQLNDELFSRFLYPLPRELRDYVPAEPGSLKYQIVVLMQILAVKGAWIDFSLVEWRIRAGQLLWEVPPHLDGDCLDPVPDEGDDGIERKWLLFQILLTGELVLRVDAAVKLGVIAKSKSLLITPQDIYQMNEMRTHQIDWGIISGRRAVENLTFKYSLHEKVEEQPPTAPKSKSSRIKARFSRSKPKVPQTIDSPWHCRLLPRFPMRQLEGLFVFAEALEWPGIEKMKEKLAAKVSNALTDEHSMIMAFDSPLKTTATSHHRLERQDMYRKSLTAKLIHLQVPPDEAEKDMLYLGGWASRSWLSGFIIPGESTNDLLIATLLENDTHALKRLGPIANLYGGFIYQGRSYWSKVCIVGRVLSTFFPRSLCMGWAGCNIMPQDEDGENIINCWVEIASKDNYVSRGEARIHQGSKILLESSPLGAEGDLTPRAFSLPIDHQDTECLTTNVCFERLTLSVHGDEGQRGEPGSGIPRKASALVSFKVSQHDSKSELVTFPLTFNVQFISSYTCLPPPGYIAHLCPSASRARSQPSYHRHVHPFVSDDSGGEGDVGETEMLARKLRPSGQPRLPGHPLHTVSYPYRYIPISVLAKMPVLQQLKPRISFMAHPDEFLGFVDPTRRWRRLRRRETYIIDARGGVDKEAYVRAWCSAVGTDAVVARIGRTCLACSIREARAANVPVVLRVGARSCEGGIRASSVSGQPGKAL
ncbi:uncharacterized protein CIMG_09996 [Coccidioides immitis RS]|uniref:Uncharacterized protein n=2 Tax=Coccidioides immitis TaxID=5501 RepID=J3K0K9_COCIM|nr:uncharacterized protein CIMG_09996 [Coccidioides immitis RS]EAS27391.3 hypothetical protein CIMG_09996 [Coccidioides immitis RS]KMP09340.1 hypothetical protein CIRG_09511 [Coccidioides immitis RMSCC 2394]TPX20200.1 hypothetical protein DIZ76_016088 [Coccidioides immitis]